MFLVATRKTAIEFSETFKESVPRLETLDAKLFLFQCLYTLMITTFSGAKNLTVN